MTSLSCNFLRLLGRSSINEEIVIRTDSIVEIWLTSGWYITVLYQHPEEDRLVEHEEHYTDESHARQRFYMILRILGAESQIEQAVNKGFVKSILTEEEDMI